MPVGLITGTGITSTIGKNVVTSLVSYVKEDQFRWQLGLEAELKRLEVALPKIQALLDAVDRGQIMDENPALEEWLWQFRDAVDEAEDFMDEIDYYRLEEEIYDEQSMVSSAASGLETIKKDIISCVKNILSCLKTVVKRGLHQDSTVVRLKEIVKRLDKAVSGIGDFSCLVGTVLTNKQPLKTSNRETSSCLTVETRVFGRDNEKKEVINKLLKFNPSKKNFSVLPIVGVGGIGKTTLAQFVYHDEGIEKHFKKRMWVCVSNNPNLILLTKKIYESTFGVKPNLDNLDMLQGKISEELKSQRFLLVLDDVWDDIDRIGLEKLLAPLRSGERGSMILLTTRITNVGGTMIGKMEPVFLNGLGEGDYWEFFKECAFLDEDPEYHKMLLDTGRRIAEKLKGSPLAAKTVGGILSANLEYQHWKYILDSEIWRLNQNENDIMPALTISYQYLPSHLKPCFRFCSIFPQDYEFDKEQLVYMWMALGLLQKPINENRRLEDTGDEYLNDLVMKSFFDCKTDDKRTYYVMHDLLHELATSLSRGECFKLEESSLPLPIPTSVRHLSIFTSVSLSTVDEITKLKNLRTLLLIQRIPEILGLLKGLTTLKILASPTLEFTDDCISNLKHLRYLRSNYYCTSQVPESVNKFYHLQFLYYGNKSISSSKLCPPDHVNNLINLRRLSTPNSVGGKVYSIGRLTSLQILEKFNVKENGNNISELNQLRQLRELGIQNLQEVTRVEKVIEADLNAKEHLRKLLLDWASQLEVDRRNVSPDVEVEVAEQVLDALRPHSDLMNLEVRNYMGGRSPHWMATEYLSNLVSISLFNCEGWADLPNLGRLRYLEFLELSSMDLVKQVGVQIEGIAEVASFPSLQVLKLSSMPELEKFYGGGMTTQWLPCLKSLSIIECPKLRVFPNLPCHLRDVHIEHVNWIVLPELSQRRNNNSLSNSSSLPSSSSSSSLSSLKIEFCPRLTSLARGLLLHPELFTSLGNLTISKCGSLTHLPTGGFGKFTSLKTLRIKGCPKLQRGSSSTSRRFLPLSLQSLAIEDCDVLDPFPKASKDLKFLSKVELKRCPNITSLPSAEVLRTWKTLRMLSIEECPHLESLGGLHALSSLKILKVKRCPKLVAAASQSASLTLDKLAIDDLSLLCIAPLKSISARDVNIEGYNEVASSELEEWVSNNSTSLQVLKMTSVSSQQFPPVYFQRLSCLENLKVAECFELQSLPKLPPSLRKLVLGNCPPELEERCLRDSGPDWSKIQHIPKVRIGNCTKEKLATITLEEHREQKLNGYSSEGTEQEEDSSDEETEQEEDSSEE
ncbi:disease resistance protein RGA2-like [Typha angustifolia]|uniref:disease resistance protein RGA2-like n=1 Tax=Typha angustifolia TaxID=59011 RepID=UPI003C2D8497